ncbi:MAG: ThiF family adenylyltransferase [Candidatus Jordarchaeum sp.]|uniref:ThiF family adenylyltransferase n=1 Tax=Candidatus Jordarchaeum sp. TaxID=2823881 RepID=UPI00404A9807
MEDRYHRQKLVNVMGVAWDQNKLLDSTALIAGVGALGCESAKNLALMGLKKLIIIDNDVVELSNLSRQMLFRDQDIGSPKVEAAERVLKEMSPGIEIEKYYDSIENVPIERYQEADVFLSSLDNFEGRRYLNSIAVSLNKPFIDAGTHSFFGHVRVIIPHLTPCYECYPPKEKQRVWCSLRRREPSDLIDELEKYRIKGLTPQLIEELFSRGYKTELDLKYAKLKDLISIPGITEDLVEKIQEKIAPKLPAILTTNAIIAGIQSQEALKVLLGFPRTAEMYRYNGLSGGLDYLNRERRTDCWLCGTQEEIQQLNVDPNSTVFDLKVQISQRYAIPDPEIAYKEYFPLGEELVIKDVGMKSNENIYVISKHIAVPKKLKLKLV